MTETAEGQIPNLEYNGLSCPVKLRVEVVETRLGVYRSIVGNHSNKPYPLRRDGKLVYALPGGGEILG